MLKLALLVSMIVESATLEMRTRAVELTGPVTVHGSEPSLAVLAKSVSEKLEPPLRESCTLTLPLTPLDVHEIVCEVPIAHDSPPFGEVTATVGPPLVIVKIDVPAALCPSGFVTVTFLAPVAAPTVLTFRATVVGFR